MSNSGLEVFDKTVQSTNVWLNEIGEWLGPDRQRAYHALSAVLWSVRDQMMINNVVHFSAQLPILIRGIFFTGWNPAESPKRERSKEAFLARVEEKLKDMRPMNPEDAVCAVFATLENHLSEGAVEKLKLSLSEPVRQLFPKDEPGVIKGADLTRPESTQQDMYRGA